MVIYDANNGTRAVREALAESFDARGIHVVMLGMARFVFCVKDRPDIDSYTVQSLSAITRS